ncbi:short-chain dehydrogenase/reductase SDR [Ruminiclostridium papyrosolvens DSM 2782]|uniref:Short-chain dehydrogenase/reductase SDR n=1 Tax=Ruminiclostridium papyrosolvens DSM 2782 TaxID=588581 RepID=F1THU0_9FIRM|nr:SDR family oxidoreductase [Ruminiclostridium papyrosolvens]EGD46072.1 short-chain dehydrogenase/reductase SDR [Ruminiclostridium papyrosolvens DSM 2782]WES32871.1 SDR family oxidoreductase [Ruminiclostridium papyrosolvens DSM 2782]
MNTQKTVLVTGASRGIGYAIAKKFAQNGFNVAINYNVNRTAAESLERELASLQCRVMTVKADVSSQEQVLYMIESVNSHLGNIDILVNNAGIAGQSLFTDITTEEWDRMFDINVKGMFHCCKAVLPQMIRNKWGKIVNISSIWGLTGASCEVHYSASKAAIIGLTRALAKEVGPSNIQVNCVAPGVIDTDMNSELDDQTLDELKEQTPLGIIGTGNDIAETVYFLTSDNAKFITGQVISPNGGFLI